MHLTNFLLQGSVFVRPRHLVMLGRLLTCAQRWMRVEGFYMRLSQSSLVPGGRLDRNRVGIRIVTSKPMRIE